MKKLILILAVTFVIIGCEKEVIEPDTNRTLKYVVEGELFWVGYIAENGEGVIQDSISDFFEKTMILPIGFESDIVASSLIQNNIKIYLYVDDVLIESVDETWGGEIRYKIK